MSVVKKVAKKAFPLHTKRGRLLKQAASAVKLAKPLHYEQSYQGWIDNIEPETFLPVLDMVKGDKPLFSIVIPFYNTKQKYLPDLFDSIINQTFGDWELIAADGSSDTKISEYIEKQCERDNRIKYYKHTKDTDISGNTNQGLDKASGEYIVFCDHDDILSLHALNEVATVIKSKPSVDIIYSDEDKVTDAGKHRHYPAFKPDWSPHLFLNTNYTNHLSVVRRSVVEKSNKLNPEHNGAQDYDFLLGLHGADRNLEIHHIPKVLYHWREAVGSTAVEFTSKSKALESGRSAVEKHLKARSAKGRVEAIKNRPGFYCAILEPEHVRNVLVVVATDETEIDREAFVQKLKSRTNTSLDVEYMTVDRSKIDDVRRNGFDAVFEFTRVCFPEKDDWLDRLVGVLELDDVEEVAPRIISPDGKKIVDMGIVYGGDGEKIALNKHQSVNEISIFGNAEWVRDVDELTGVVRGYRTIKVGKSKKYHVVWSHVDFKQYPVFGKQSMFNTNLSTDEDGKVVPNEY